MILSERSDTLNVIAVSYVLSVRSTLVVNDNPTYANSSFVLQLRKHFGAVPSKFFFKGGLSQNKLKRHFRL